jgi:tyrosine-protein phosphatase SIW14
LDLHLKFKLLKRPLLILVGFVSLLCLSSLKKEQSLPSNFHKVNEEIYRSSQPNKQNFQALTTLGIKSVLNLRHTSTDKKEAKGSSLELYHVPINTWTIQEKHIIQALKIIESAPKPIVIHCLHGSDRTGAIVAAHRIIYQNWTKEQAITELRKSEYGYHEQIFPSIKKIIEGMDVERIKKEHLKN